MATKKITKKVAKKLLKDVHDELVKKYFVCSLCHGTGRDKPEATCPQCEGTGKVK